MDVICGVVALAQLLGSFVRALITVNKLLPMNGVSFDMGRLARSRPSPVRFGPSPSDTIIKLGRACLACGLVYQLHTTSLNGLVRASQHVKNELKSMAQCKKAGHWTQISIWPQPAYSSQVSPSPFKVVRAMLVPSRKLVLRAELSGFSPFVHLQRYPEVNKQGMFL